MLTGWRDFDDTLRAIDLLQRRLDRAFDQWAEPYPQGERARRRPRTAWPPTNVFETKEAFVVKAEVPGLAEGDVAVSVEDEALVVRGERKSDVPEGYTVHLRERSPVAFTRKLPLPARVDSDAVSATLRDGVLTITLPKAKEALPRQIAVKAG
ncbi:MAG: Hsp20/alpha crystallin family protein [Myxococcales bacterium]|nr:Hsp20/alpha crystallin family protein [Myxococcales bacterium]